MDPEIADVLARAVIVPATPFNRNIHVPENQEEKLKTIIRNIEAHNQKVRANIINLPPRPAALAPTDPASTRSAARQARQDRTNDSLIAALSIPRSPSAAPKPMSPFKPTPPSQSRSQRRAVDPLPATVGQMYRKLQALDAYNEHSERGLLYYRKALERRSSVASVPEVGSMSDGVGAMGPPAAAGLRRGSDVSMGGTSRRGSDVAMGGAGAEGGAGQAPTAPRGIGSGGTYDPSRDPRLTR
ncbi:hypothetical protein K432DRAFT_385494 [Lepidopterella palustris CBS 459.81]|uniref:Uncharacterized protein n=1 Tax=Lepidopterella palustris CBS 459.81 TaxID=1314670 RepID=A0A8E2E385_9PEZI|nr:hypothetical protein K432DRAFT_385494 [Lepidopterella palustris CBS 459.81]